MESTSILDNILSLLLAADECIAKLDDNSALKKIHEAIKLIEQEKEKPVNE